MSERANQEPRPEPTDRAGVSPAKKSIDPPTDAGRRRRRTREKSREYCAENRIFELRAYICDLHLSLRIALPIS